MKKLLTGTAIVFLMILTAGMASAHNNFPFNGTGTLYFIDNTGSATVQTDAAITVDRVSPGTLPHGVAKTLYYGTLTYTDPVAGPTTVDFTAVPGAGGVYLLNGVTEATTPVEVTAQVKFAGRAIVINGAELGGTALSFEGRLLRQNP